MAEKAARKVKNMCPYCLSSNTEYMGIDDGGGEYGTSVCDEYECLECGAGWSSDCMEIDGFEVQ